MLSGCVHPERVGPIDERFVMHCAIAVPSFAEAAIFSDYHHCNAVVIEASEFVRVGKTAALGSFADVEFARAYERAAAIQIQAQRQLLEIVGIRNANERVSAGLVAGLLNGKAVALRRNCT